MDRVLWGEMERIFHAHIIRGVVFVHGAALVFLFALLKILVLVRLGLGLGGGIRCCRDAIWLGCRGRRGRRLLWRIEIVIIVIDIHLVSGEMDCACRRVVGSKWELSGRRRECRGRCRRRCWCEVKEAWAPTGTVAHTTLLGSCRAAGELLTWDRCKGCPWQGGTDGTATPKINKRAARRRHPEASIPRIPAETTVKATASHCIASRRISPAVSHISCHYCTGTWRRAPRQRGRKAETFRLTAENPLLCQPWPSPDPPVDQPVLASILEPPTCCGYPLSLSLSISILSLSLLLIAASPSLAYILCL